MNEITVTVVDNDLDAVDSKADSIEPRGTMNNAVLAEAFPCGTNLCMKTSRSALEA